MNTKSRIPLSSIDAQNIIDVVIRKGASFAEVFAEHKKTYNVVAENNKISHIQQGVDAGVGIRAIFNNSVSYVYAEDFSVDSLLKAANLAGSMGTMSAMGKKHPNSNKNNIMKKQFSDLINLKEVVLPQNIKSEERVSKILEIVNGGQALSNSIRQVSVKSLEIDQEVMVANSEGLLARDHRVKTRVMAQALAERQGELQLGTETVGQTRGFEFFEKNKPFEVGYIAAERALRLLEATNPPSGTMPVVIGNNYGGVLFHEAAGHGLEADAILNNGSAFSASQVNELIANPLITMIDDGTVQNAYGTTSIDDEGNPTKKNVLIENGVLKQFMNDNISSRKSEVNLTGNGRRQSYRYVPMPRMTNTYIAPGPHSTEEIINSTKWGLYAKKLGGGEVNITNGDFVFMVNEAYLIENGKVTSPVRGAILRGNGPRALQNIDMVADDLRFDSSNCGKEGQVAHVTCGSPHVRINELVVGGY
ncbi:TldD/PmbA family protein [Evansella clarkii]|uniref:TldD/PmbA family protein n=1 Tax=Evansella clarkii TaxID=79879 RepID=UPI001473FCA6|nr:TldD/PmbA family protein [Evansella clarkii]